MGKGLDLFADIVTPAEQQGRIDQELFEKNPMPEEGAGVFDLYPENEADWFDRGVKDTGVSLLSGIADLGGAAVGLADIPTGGAVGKQLEEWGYSPEGTRESIEDMYSAEQKGINAEVEGAEGFIGMGKAMLSNPSTLWHGAFKSLPLMGAGGVIGAGIRKLAPKVGVATAAGAGEGVISGGLSATQIREMTEDGSITAKQGAIAAVSGLFTALFGVGGGKLSQKLGVIDPDTFIVNKLGKKVINPVKMGLLRSIGGTMLSEGLFEELPQSMQEQVMQNWAMDERWDKGVPEAAVAGALIGAAAAAPFGAMRSGSKLPEVPPEDELIEDRRRRLGVKRDRPTMYALPDGSVGTRKDISDYLRTLPKSERAAARAKILKRKIKPVDTEDVQQAQDTAAKGDATTAAEDLISKVTAEREADFDAAERETERQKQKDFDTITKAEALERGTTPAQVAAASEGVSAASVISDAFDDAKKRKEQKKKPKKKEVNDVSDSKVERPDAAEGERTKQEETAKVEEEKILTVPKEAADESISESELPASAEDSSREQIEQTGRESRAEEEGSDGRAKGDTDKGSVAQAGSDRASVATADKPYRELMLEINDRKRDMSQVDGREDVAAKTSRLRSIYNGEREPDEKDVKYYRAQARRLEKKGRVQRTDNYDEQVDYYRRIAEALKTPPIDVAAQEAATSLQNDKPQPSEAQIEAGNYEKGHVSVSGIPISIENPEGSNREGKDSKGKKWKVKLKSHYGYIKSTTGNDKDNIDVFLKPNIPNDFGGRVFVVNQKNEKGKFDEHKVILGVNTVAEARKLYNSNYAKGWDGINSVASMEMDEFKEWVEKGNHKKPASSRPRFARNAARAGNRHNIAPTREGLPFATVRAIVSLVKSTMKNPPPVKVVMRGNNLPKDLLREFAKQQEKGATGFPMGAFHDGVVYVVASEMRNENTVILTMFHEILGHYGLHGKFGKGLDAILLEVAEARQDEVAIKLKQYGLDPNKVEDVMIAAEEILADMAQTNPQLSLVRRAIAAIREFLRKHFPKRFQKWVGEVTDDELIKNIIIPARNFVIQNRKGGKVKPVKSTFFDLTEYESELTSPLADNIEQILNPKFGVVNKKDGTANIKSAIDWIKARSVGNNTLFSRVEVDAINLIEYIETFAEPKRRKEHDMEAIRKIVGESLTYHQEGVQAFRRAADKWLEAKRSRLSKSGREITGQEVHIKEERNEQGDVTEKVDITEERILEQIEDQARISPRRRSENRVDAILKSVKPAYGAVLREYLALSDYQLYERGSGNYTDSLQNSMLHELIDYGFTNEDYKNLYVKPLDSADAEERLPAELKKGAIIAEGDKRVHADLIVEFVKNNGLDIEIRAHDTEGDSKEFDVYDHEGEYEEDRDNWVDERYEEKKEEAMNNMDEDAFPYYTFEDTELENPEYDQDAADSAAEAEEDYDVEEYITGWKVRNHNGDVEEEVYETEEDAQDDADNLNDTHFTEWLDSMKEDLEDEFGSIGRWADDYGIEDRWRDDNPESSGTTQYPDEPDYVLNGAENYREIFFNLPSQQMVFNPKSKKMEPRGRLYSSGHFDEEDAARNLLFHLRVSDRIDAQGNSVLFIEELQSDWAKSGMSWSPKHPHRQGFRRDRTDEEVNRGEYIRERLVVAKNEIQSIEDFTKAKAEEDYDLNKGEIENEDAIKIGKQVRTSLALKDNEELKNLNAEVSALLKELTVLDRIEQGTRPAPFVTESQAWQRLAAKEIISLAVREGYSRVAWTNATQQVVRYEGGLRTRLDRIRWEKKADADGKPVVEVRGYKGNKIDTDVLMNLTDQGLETRAQAAAMAYQSSEFYGTWLALIKRLRLSGSYLYFADKQRALIGERSQIEIKYRDMYEYDMQKALSSGEEVLENIREKINAFHIAGTSQATIKEQNKENIKNLAYWIQVQNTLRDYAIAYGVAYGTSDAREAMLGDQKVKHDFPHNLMEDAVGFREWNEIKNSPEQSGIIETENMTIDDTGMAQFYHHAMPRQFDKIFQQMLGKNKLKVEMYDMRKKKELTEDEVVAEDAWEKYVKENNFHTKPGDDHFYKSADLYDGSRTMGTIAEVRQSWEADRRRIGGRYGTFVEENPKKIDQKSVNIQPSFEVTAELKEKYSSDKISKFRRFENQDEVPDMTGFDSSKRSFLKAAGALAAWAAFKPRAAAATLPVTLEERLRSGDFHGALEYIEKNSEFPAYRRTAARLRVLLPPDIKLNIVQGLNLQGVTVLDRKELTVTISLRDDKGSPEVNNGLDEGTVLHEAVHAAIMARYDLINIYSANPGRWGKRNADAALKEYIGVWKEFRRVIDNEVSDGEEIPVWMDESYSDPDEFIAYALTSPEMQIWLQAHKYRGKTLWAKLKAALKKMLGFSQDPTWLDAAMIASNSVLDAAAKDNPDFTVTISLAKRIKGQAINQAILFKKGNSPDEFAAQNKAFREKNVSYRTRVQKFLQKHFSPGGLLEKEVFAAKIQRDNEFSVIEFEVAHLVGELQRAIKKDYKMDAMDLPELTQELMNDVMAGEIADVPERTKLVLLAMREHIDGMSNQYVAALEAEIQDMAQMLRDEGNNIKRGDQATIRDLAVKVDLLHTIQNNIGHYIHRSYKAFDDPTWHKKVPVEHVNTARRYLIARHRAKGLSETEAKRRAEVILNDIVKNGTAYDSMEGFIRESKLGAKDLGVLKKRGNIAPEIRQLLGEYKDPRVNFAKSVTKMGRLIFNQKFLEKVREVGLNKFMWTEDRKPPEATAQLAADGSEIMAPLNGLWVTPETDKAFKDALGKENMEKWYKTIVKMNGMVKYGKTILSPTTAARNWISAAFFSIANGHWNWTHMSKSLTALNEYFNQMGTKEKLEYLKHLKKLGVVYDTPYAGEMIRLLADTEAMNYIAGNSKTKLAARKFFQMATKFYQFGDDFWKIIGFENEKKLWMKNGMSLEEAEVQAAERIRNTYPTYSMVGSAIQSLRRFPLAGTFVSFPAEIIRTSYNMFKYTAEDFRTPGRKGIAINRAVGLGVASSFAWALQAVSKGLMGVDDDEEEAVRLMGAPWNRNANLFFLGRDEDGNIRFLDISFADPYNMFKRMWTALFRDTPIDVKMKEVIWDEGLTPFLGQDILAGTLFEIFANKKESGGRVYRERDEPLKQTADITEHLWKTVRPGVAANVSRTLMAIKGETSKSGRKYNLWDEIRSWIGFRFTTMDAKVALFYRSFAFTDTKRDANSNITDVIKDPNEVTKSDMRSALSVAQRIRETGYKEMHLLTKAAMRTGLSRNEVIRILRTSNITKQDVMAIMDGTVPAWRPNITSAKNQAKKARTIYGQEGTDRVIRRYKDILKLAR